MKKLFTFFIAMVLFNSIFGQTNSFQKEPYMFFKNKINQSTGEVTTVLDKIVIQWQLTTYPNDPCRFQYGLDQYSGLIVTANYNLTDNLWYVELDLDDDLNPNEFYYYQAFIMDDDIPVDGREGSFITPPSENTTNLTFFAYSDPQNPNPDLPSERHNIACERINDLIDANPSSQTLLLNSGDWNDAETEDSWNINYFNNGQTQSEVRELLAKIPVMGVYGNHDMWDVQTPGPMVFEKYWPYSYVIPADPDEPYNRYYSFDYGPIHVSCLHLAYDNWNITSEELLWLDSDLSDTDKKWKILVFHTPGYSNGSHSLNLSVQNDVQPLCVLHGVQLVISGHQNVYAHWLVQGVHHLTIDGVGRTYNPGSSNYNDIGELKTHVFNHFAEINIENDFMNIIIHYFDGTTWHSDFDTYTQPSAYKICNNEHITWDQDINYADEIRICSGSTLIIKSKVGFVENGKIIVERGGKLELEGGTLTSVNEDELWKGIEVWGDPTRTQSQQYQGVVEITNGGTIENSICGISTIRMGTPGEGEETPDYNYTGGIILCEDAIFKNNQTAVKFWNYNYAPSVSYFRECYFITSDDLLDGTEVNCFIEMAGISGVHILGNSFTDEHAFIEPDELTTGIYANNSQFYVLPQGGQPNVFTRLYYGIKALATSPITTIEIENNEFINNLRSVYLSATNNAQVNLNLFNPWTEMLIDPAESYCMYLDHCTGYQVEQNTFTNEVGTHKGIGLIVNQSGNVNNMIYLNYFNNLLYGALAQNENRNKTGTLGLQFKCNEFTENASDLSVTYVPPKTKSTGIAASQGSNSTNPSGPAGNLFSWTGPTGNPTDINNEAQHVTYYYHGDYPLLHLEPKYVTTFTVTPQSVYGAPWNEQSCPPDLEGGGGGGFRGIMVLAEQKADSLQEIISALEDGGNTIGLKEDVEWSIPPESMEVYNELMSNSPYLTDTVIGAAIEKEEVLVNAMIRDVMVANPQSSKDDELIEKLDERSNPVPEYMMGEILQGRSLVSVYEELQSKLSFYTQQRNAAYQSLVTSFLTDTVNPDASTDSLAVLFSNEQTTEAKYALAFLSMEQGAWSTGLEILNQVSSQFNLTEEQQAEHQYLVELCTLLSGLNGALPDSTQLNGLNVIESANAGIGSVYARNILLALDKTEYSEPVILPGVMKSSEAVKYEQYMQSARNMKYLEVFPNPSKDHVIISWKLDKSSTGIKIVITDNTGKNISEIEVNSFENQKVFDTRNLKPGVYIATIYIDGKQKDNAKFTIVK